jgi:predicted homoserine dehydrogenase-like protein
MNLQSMLAARIAADKPVRIGLIGAGKFGSMFLAQVPLIAGLDVVVISDLDPERVKAACRTVGWDAGRIARTGFTEQGRDACVDERVEVVVEATGMRLPESPMPSRRSKRASTSLWSMSKPTYSVDRGSPEKRVPPT